MDNYETSEQVPNGNKRSLLYILYILTGVMAGAILAGHSVVIGLMGIAAFIAIILPFFRPSWALYIFVSAMIMMTDSFIPGKQDFFSIPDLDLIEGLPSVLTTYFIFMFGIVLMKKLLIDKNVPICFWKFTGIYGIIMTIALMTGLHRNGNRELIQTDFISMLFPFLFFYLCSMILTDRKTIRQLIVVLCSVTLLKACILAAYYMVGRGWPYITTGEDFYRIATFDSADLLVIITVLLIFMSLAIQRETRFPAKIAFAFISLPLIFVIIFAFRRAQWIGLVFSLGLMWLLSLREERKMIAMSGALACLIIVALMVFSDAGAKQFERIAYRTKSIVNPDNDSNKYHLLESKQTLEDLVQTPLTGLGLGSKHTPLGLYDEDIVPLNIVHNTWLYIWMKLGLPGLLFYLWALWKLFQHVLTYRRNIISTNDWSIILPLASSAGLWFAMSITGPVPWYLHQTFMIALMAAIIIQQAKAPYENNACK